MNPKVKFEVRAGLYCDFLTHIAECEIYIADIKSTDFGFTAVCLAKDYAKISKAAKKYQCKTRIIQKKGAYFSIKALTDRKGIIAGTVFVFISIMFFTKLIWRIDVISPDKEITQDIYSLLYKNDCYVGAVFNQEKNQDIIQQIFMDVDNVGYVTLNFYKGILTCKVDGTKNKMPYTQDSTSGNITATADGVIEEIEIYNGFSDIKKGQTVTKGDVLVSATYIDRNGTLQQVMPRAFIKAYCVKEYSVQVMLDKNLWIRNGEYSDRITFKLLNKDFTVKKEEISGYNQFDVQKYFEFLTVLGFRLPVTKETVRYYKKEITNIKNNEQTAYLAGKKIIDSMLKNDASLIEVERCEYQSKSFLDAVMVLCKVYGYYDITR